MAPNIRHDPGYEGHRIVPSIPDAPEDTYEDTDHIEERGAGNGDRATIPEFETNGPELETESQSEQVDVRRHIDMRTLPPSSNLIAPSASVKQLYARMSDSESESSGDDDDPGREGEEAHYNDDLLAEDAYRPGFHLQPAESSSSTLDSLVHPSPGDFHQTGVQAGAEPNARDAHIAQEGQTSVSAILIQDSPTPPLRPSASTHARLAASANGRCGVGSDESDPPPLNSESKTSLGELVCPICLGPPTPLVVTACGHTFCGPCLHSAITNQSLTPQLLEQIPTAIGKDLEGTCPVCRHILRGGWGRGLRGAILRMGHSEGPAYP